MAEALSQVWKVGDAKQLCWRCWDDEYVVFDPFSGDTHVLNRLAAEALRALEASAMDAPGLAKKVATALDLQEDEELIRHMEKLLVQFDQLGLVEPQHQ